jgi:hypothetical protein
VVEDQFPGERAQKHVGDVVVVAGGGGVAKQRVYMGAVSGVDAVKQALARRSGLGGEEHIALDLDLLEQPVAEGDETLARRDTGSEGRGATDEVFLKGPLALVKERTEQTTSIAEPAKERALPHPCGTSDLVHRDAVRSPLRHEPLGGAQDRDSVARSVGALMPGGFKQR